MQLCNRPCSGAETIGRMEQRRLDECGIRLNVALVYQDARTRQWAGQVRDLMAGVVGQEAIRCTEWKISDLVEPRAYWEGVAALAHADVIVVSLYEAERLPAAFYLWVNLWLQERSGRPGVLVALLVPPEESNSGAIETRRYLSAVASQGHLELLMQESNRPGEPILDFGKTLCAGLKRLECRFPGCDWLCCLRCQLYLRQVLLPPLPHIHMNQREYWFPSTPRNVAPKCLAASTPLPAVRVSRSSSCMC